MTEDSWNGAHVPGAMAGLMVQVARIETEAKETQRRISSLETSVSGMDAKLDAISADIKTAKSGLQLGWGLMAKMITPAGIGAGFTWLLTHFWAK